MSLAIAWTTTGTEADALRLAEGALGKRLTACVQISGPITSVYRWEGRGESAVEWRLTFKTPQADLAALEAWVVAQHPYEVPQWVVVIADHVLPTYLAWAEEATRGRE